MVRIAPSILSADFAKLGEQITAVEKAGADWIHVDVMDGHFVPNLTFGAPVLRSLRKVTQLDFDVHLMVTNPDALIQPFKDAGANWLTVHVEVTHHLQRTLSAIRQAGMKAGVSLNPHTPPDALRYVMDDLDLILVMSVNPGFGGQSFLPSALTKISEIRQAIGARDIRLSVDGGINRKTAPAVLAAGADVLVAGQAIFGETDYKTAIDGLRQS